MGRFDLSFKALCERDDNAPLALFGRTPLSDAKRIQHLERELAMGVKSVDYAYAVETRAGERFIEHFEAETTLDRADMESIAERAALLGMKTRLPVWTSIIFLSRRGARRSLEGEQAIGVVRGGIELKLQLRLVKLWELDGETILRLNDPRALPVIGAMKTSPAALDAAIEQICRVQDKKMRSALSAELVTWCGLRYNGIELDGIRGRLAMVSTKDVLAASLIGEEILEYGRQEGRKEGALEAVRKSVSFLLSDRFPDVAAAFDLDAVRDLSAAENLFRALLSAKGAAEARTACDRAIRRH